MVSAPSGTGQRTVIGIFAAGSGIFGPLAGMLQERIGWRATFQILAAVFFVFTMAGAYLLKDPPEGYTGPAENPKVRDARRASRRYRHFAGAANPALHGAVGGIRAGHHGRHPGD